MARDSLVAAFDSPEARKAAQRAADGVNAPNTAYTLLGPHGIRGDTPLDFHPLHGLCGWVDGKIISDDGWVVGTKADPDLRSFDLASAEAAPILDWMSEGGR